MNVRKLRLICFLAFAISSVAVPAAGQSEKAKVLLITGGHGFEEKAFLKVFQDNPALTLTHASHGKTNATAYEREDLFSYDALVLYDMPKEITERQKARFMTLFDKGIGLLVLHHALVSYQHWPEYEHIIGGRYPEADGKSGIVTASVGYQHDVEVPIVILATNHPITTGLSDFTIKDEIYWGFRVQPDVIPLLSTTYPKSGKPLAWTRNQGKSRIVYLQLGHDHSAYENPRYRELVARAIQYVRKE